MKIRELYLDGNSIEAKSDFHRQIGDLLNAQDFIDGYGYNLYALWDILSSGAGLNCVLHWENSEISKQKLGNNDFDVIVEVLREAEGVTWPGGYIPFKLILE